MNIAISAHNLTREHGDVKALDGVTFTVKKNTITGLLGSNGAGKTSFMSIATGQDLPTSGKVLVNGATPYERAQAVEQMCFIRDNQRYPDDYKLRHCLRAGAIAFPHWDAEFADHLVELFRIPSKTVVKKFSRGQFSALGIVMGLASRAPITFFDEPYLGLDASSRVMFYDTLLEDFTLHPRTVLVSTHLIDEMERLLEHVIILERGRVVHDAEVEELRTYAHQVTGRVSDVEAYCLDRVTLKRHSVGGLATAVVEGAGDQRAAATNEVDLSGVSLQDLVATYGSTNSLESVSPAPLLKGQRS